MRNVLFVIGLVLGVFILQFFLVNTIGRQWTPNFLLLLIVFITLVLGIRLGLTAALIGGFLLDSYSADQFGLNILAMILCSYLVVVIHRYLFHSGSRQAILFLTFLILVFDVLWKFFLHALVGYVDVKETFLYVFLPEVILTLLFASTFYRGLRQCVSRLFA